MDRKELKLKLSQMNRMPYIHNFHLLQNCSSKFDLFVDFDSVYFNYSDRNSTYPLQMAAIYSVLIEDDKLYILTKDKQFHYLHSETKEHIAIDTNCYSIWSVIKQIFHI